MLEIEEFTQKNLSTLRFSGDLSIAQATQFQQQLLKFAAKATHIDIKIDNVENMDLSFLQLLFSWAKSMKKSEKKLNFEFMLNEEFSRIFDESGFRQVFEQL